VLAQLEQDGVETVSSADIGRLAATNGAQVRKDLSYFGDFGRRGLGYKVSELRAQLRAILGLERGRNVAIIGAGNLGSALVGYPGFEMRGFHVVAVFDNDPAKVGRRLRGLRILPLTRLTEVAATKDIAIAILAVPEFAAQIVADRVAEAGIRAILNFAPRHIHAPPGVVVCNVDMTSQLEFLSYFLTQGETELEAEEC